MRSLLVRGLLSPWYIVIYDWRGSLRVGAYLCDIILHYEQKPNQENECMCYSKRGNKLQEMTQLMSFVWVCWDSFMVLQEKTLNKTVFSCLKSVEKQLSIPVVKKKSCCKFSQLNAKLFLSKIISLHQLQA